MATSSPTNTFWPRLHSSPSLAPLDTWQKNQILVPRPIVQGSSTYDEGWTKTPSCNDMASPLANSAPERARALVDAEQRLHDALVGKIVVVRARRGAHDFVPLGGGEPELLQDE